MSYKFQACPGNIVRRSHDGEHQDTVRGEGHHKGQHQGCLWQGTKADADLRCLTEEEWAVGHLPHHLVHQPKASRFIIIAMEDTVPPRNWLLSRYGVFPVNLILFFHANSTMTDQAQDCAAPHENATKPDNSYNAPAMSGLPATTSS